MSQRAIVGLFCGYFLLMGLLGLGPLSRDPLRSTPFFAGAPGDAIIGHGQAIRSDEYANTTPRVLALRDLQPILKGADINPLLGAGVPATPANVTSNGQSLFGLLLAPHSLFFHFWPGPWGWAMSLALQQCLFVLTALALLTLYGFATKSRLLFATALATLAFSPHVQRWLIVTGFTFAYFGPLIFALRNFLQADQERGPSRAPAGTKRRTMNSDLAALPVVWAAACFFNAFYPPQMYAYGLVLLPLVFARPLKREHLQRLGAAAGLVGVGFALGFAGPIRVFIHDLSFGYLKQRSFNGGDYAAPLLLNLLWPGLTRAINASEDAVIFLGPLLVLVAIGAKHLKGLRLTKTQKAGLCVAALMLIWLFAPIPGAWVRWIGLDRVSTRRMTMGLYHLAGIFTLLALAHLWPKLRGRKLKVARVLLGAQLVGVTWMGLFWNPLADMKKLSDAPPSLPALQKAVGGGYLLASTDVLFGAALAPLGIRSLVGRFDAIAPELAAFLLAGESSAISASDAKSAGGAGAMAIKTNASDLRDRLFAPFIFAWDTHDSQSFYAGDAAHFVIDPCRDELRTAGLRAVATNRTEADTIKERCPGHFSDTPIGSDESARLLTMREPLPAVMILPAERAARTGMPAPRAPSSLHLISDTPLLQNAISPALVRKIEVEIEGRHMSYSYEWTRRGLEVHADPASLGEGSWVATTMIESRFLRSDQRAGGAECEALRKRTSPDAALWTQSSGDYLKKAGRCVFKSTTVDAKTGDALFAY